MLTFIGWEDQTTDATTPGIYRVQAVNEYGGLSEKSTAVSTTAVRELYTAPAAMSVRVYQLSGVQSTGLVRGLNIVRWANGTVRKVLH